MRRRSRKRELSDLMRFVEFTNKFKAIERLIWYNGVDRRECDGEHAFQLALVAWFANERFELGLDSFLLMVYALVHDLVETYAGDTPAFVNNGNGAESPCRLEKAAREREALKRIESEWEKTFPAMIIHMRAYEEQQDEESRFLYALDKLLAEMNIVHDNGRTNHRLGVSLETADLYKRPRIARHSFVLELYDELFERMLADKDRLFPRSGVSAGSVT